jgi:molybdate transport system substrate-binding protein
MATRQVLAELAAAYRAASGVEVVIESVGGVDAAKRVQAGEAFDVVMLAADAIDKLIAGGSVLAAARVDLVRSAVAIAVREGAPRPDVSTEDRLAPRRARRAQPRLFHRPERHRTARAVRRWGIADAVARPHRPGPGRRAGGATGGRGPGRTRLPALSEMLTCPASTWSAPCRRHRDRHHVFRRRLRRLDPARGGARAARLHAIARRGGRPSATTAWNRHRSLP